MGTGFFPTRRIDVINGRNGQTRGARSSGSGAMSIGISNDENNKWSHGGEDDPAENLLTGVACSLLMDIMEAKCEAKATEGYNACIANSHNQPIHVVNPWIPYAPPDPTNFGF